jgi:HEAT repeat protein
MGEEPSQAELKEQITKTIAKVRELSRPTIGFSNARSEAAERLPRLTQKINPSEIDDQTLADLVSLLDTWDDAVRMWVAASLGNLGPRAKAAAVPKLLETLPEVDCLWVDLSSEGAIRLALKRMGETPPTSPPCERAIDPVEWRKRIAEDIAKVRTSDSALAREKAAMHLGYSISWLGPEQIEDGTVTELVSLLDIPDQAVRDGVATALGDFGQRARVKAAPKLRELLVPVDCRKENQDSSVVIREALERLGAKAAPAKCATDGH